MDMLDALEQKVTELLSEIAVLRKKNFHQEKLLKTSAATAFADRTPQLENQCKRLEKKLETEKRARQTVLAKIDYLIKRLEENSYTG
jgi:predicted RecB family endonuclease